MMSKGYFLRVRELSPTRMWINNPTPLEAERAIEAGAISCTTNPTYAIKQIRNRETSQKALAIVDQTVRQVKDDAEAAERIQQRLVKPIMDVFLPLYEAKPGQEGFVSIQGDPFSDDDPAYIVGEARRFRLLGENFIAKIPVTKAGLEAMGVLIAENMPIIATEVMSIAQAVHTCELYLRVSRQSGISPPFFLTHITGIFDQYLKEAVKREGIEISPDILWHAGCVVARRLYRIFKSRGYPGIMLGGGARDLHHFTEMVGSEMHITINWKGTADKLLEENPPVVYRMETPVPQFYIDELQEKIPDFRRAYNDDGLSPEEFKEFGPVALFRSMFLDGWRGLLNTIAERRLPSA